jgi:hypothetical protein
LFKVASPESALMYQTALESGFRVDELRHLTVKSLNRFEPSLFLSGDFTKNRKDARQPISKELGGMLAQSIVGKPDTAPLLDIASSVAWSRFKADVKKAGIAPETADGRATWHSLRKSFVNSLVRSGQDLKTVMTLARHSAASLTMETYASASPALLRSAVEAAAQHVKDAISAAGRCTGVAIAVAGGMPENIQAQAGSPLAPDLHLMRATGVEPVFPPMGKSQENDCMAVSTMKRELDKNNQGQPGEQQNNAGRCTGVAQSLPPDLEKLAGLWPRLSDTVKAEIMVLAVTVKP